MTNADNLLSEPFQLANVQRSNDLFRRDSTFDTLPYPAPFVRDGLRYASPAVEWDYDVVGGAGMFSPTTSFTFSVAQTGDNIATNFPQAALIASQQMVQPCAILGLSLSYAITNATFLSPIGLYVLIDNRPIVSIAANSSFLLGTITPAGAAAMNWSDIRNNSFSLDVAPMVNVGESVSLYCSCANDVTNLVWGMVTIKYVVM